MPPKTSKAPPSPPSAGESFTPEPQLTVSILGLFKVDGRGVLGVRAALMVAVVLCVLAIVWVVAR